MASSNTGPSCRHPNQTTSYSSTHGLEATAATKPTNSRPSWGGLWSRRTSNEPQPTFAGPVNDGKKTAPATTDPAPRLINNHGLRSEAVQALSTAHLEPFHSQLPVMGPKTQATGASGEDATAPRKEAEGATEENAGQVNKSVSGAVNKSVEGPTGLSTGPLTDLSTAPSTVSLETCIADSERERDVPANQGDQHAKRLADVRAAESQKQAQLATELSETKSLLDKKMEELSEALHLHDRKTKQLSEAESCFKYTTEAFIRVAKSNRDEINNLESQLVSNKQRATDLQKSIVESAEKQLSNAREKHREELEKVQTVHARLAELARSLQVQLRETKDAYDESMAGLLMELEAVGRGAAIAVDERDRALAERDEAGAKIEEQARELALLEAFEMDVFRITVDTKQRNEELLASKQELQASNQQLQTSNHELQTSNQQLQMSNHELQTSNQQLQMSNQELQTSNQELQTSNQGLLAARDHQDNLIKDMQHTVSWLMDDQEHDGSILEDDGSILEDDGSILEDDGSILDDEEDNGEPSGTSDDLSELAEKLKLLALEHNGIRWEIGFLRYQNQQSEREIERLRAENEELRLEAQGWDRVSGAGDAEEEDAGDWPDGSPEDEDAGESNGEYVEEYDEEYVEEYDEECAEEYDEEYVGVYDGEHDGEHDGENNTKDDVEHDADDNVKRLSEADNEAARAWGYQPSDSEW